MHNFLTLSSSHSSVFPLTLNHRDECCNTVSKIPILSLSKSKPLKRSVNAILVLLAVGLSAPAAAADCKGKAESQCLSNQACSWVGTYQRKDGRTVKGFCRAKSTGGKSVSQAPAVKPKAK
jgi:hypothetical protein